MYVYSSRSSQCHLTCRPSSYNFLITVGIAYFFVFGTQRDVLHVWFFWNKDLGTDTRTGTGTGTDTEDQRVTDVDLALRSANAKGVTITSITTRHDDGIAETILSSPLGVHHKQRTTPAIVMSRELRFELSMDGRDPSQ